MAFAFVNKKRLIEYLICQKMAMEQKPIPFTATGEGSVYIANPIDWQAILLTIVKWCMILFGLGLSAYFSYGIFTT